MLTVRKIGFFAPLMLVLALPGFAQWYNQVSGTVDNLYAVRFATKDTGIAVGGSLNQSTFLKTTNGGLSWQTLHFSSSKWMYALEYLGNGTFVTAGYNGVIYKTTDYGSTWNPRPSGTSEWIYDLYFPHPDTGYAVGLNGVILRSVNGGDNWSSLPYQAPVTLLDVHFYTPRLGMAVGIDGRIFKTTNAGSTWEEMNNEDNRTLSSVWMVDADTIVACGFEGLILRSTNGGQSWGTVISGTPHHLQDLVLAENGILYAVGYGSIIRSSDAGISWSIMNYPVTTDLTAVEVVDVGTAYAVGLSGTIIKNDLSLTAPGFSEKQIIVYPNPAKTECFINIPEEMHIQEVHLTDIQGVIVLKYKVTQLVNYRIPLESLPPGAYFIHFRGNDFSLVTPVLITR